ncbi:MAG TPA: ring-cleaving dioxygenase [Nitrososphaera sp.]|nr:ring-cleaving dioxygenase [Nitrososphaera sp.]
MIEHNQKSEEEGVLGIHHITAIARNPQRNIDFYSGLMGLRLVKLTVNFDDPTTYHLYYGNSLGRPGTILTFFPWSEAPTGYRGTGQVTAISFLIPSGSMTYWIDRLKSNGISFVGPSKRFSDEFVSFHDPDGLTLELISPSSNDSQGQLLLRQTDNDIWKESPISKEHAIRGFHSATLSEEGYEHTASLLTDTMGFKLVAKDNKEDRFRFRIVEKNNNNQRGDSGSTESSQSLGSFVDVVCQPEISRGYIGIGTVHHIAWRAANDRHQIDLRKRIVEEAKLNPTPVIDRTYFHSVYFREPGGILFEIATDPPGFAIDERPEDLGKHLKLPEWLEPVRGKLEQLLPPVKTSPERQ